MRMLAPPRVSMMRAYPPDIPLMLIIVGLLCAESISRLCRPLAPADTDKPGALCRFGLYKLDLVVVKLCMLKVEVQKPVEETSTLYPEIRRLPIRTMSRRRRQR
jgi:hypothetical protein